MLRIFRRNLRRESGLILTLIGGVLAQQSAAVVPWPCPHVHKRIHLTFDDGPSPGNTEQILETLKSEKVQATFFVLGNQLKDPLTRALLEQEIVQGHQVGSHTFSHINSELEKYSMNQVELNIQKFYKRLNQINADRLAHHLRPLVASKYIRMPYGAYFWNQDRLKNPRAQRLRTYLRDQGLQHVLWDIDSQDYILPRSTDAEAYATRVLQRIARVVCDPTSPQDLVVLMHDIQPQTARGLKKVIQTLKVSGQSFVSLNEVLANKTFTDPTRINPLDPTFDPIDFTHENPQPPPEGNEPP